jgi:signal transduction histidine kinase/DNA-binding response OmpR family regulator
VEERGYSALILDDALHIVRAESKNPDVQTTINQFLEHPLFDVLPELDKYENKIRALSSPFERLAQTDLRLSQLDPYKLYDVFIMGPDLESSSPHILVLICTSKSGQQHILDQLREERKAKQKARRASVQARRASTKFLANISHEIRTPMNGVIGMTELLLATDQTDEQREFTEIIRTSGEALLNVINDILDYSKIESDHIVVENESFNLRTCIEECLDIHAARAAQKDIELIYSLMHPCPETIIGDRKKLLQILNNLVSNAIKFTDRGEVVITVNCRHHAEDSSRLAIKVRDTGIGIPKYAQKQIFSAFEQIESSQTGRQGGTGLGLAIASRLVHVLGGSLSVKSQLGKGSTFYFDIPVDCTHRSSKSTAPDRNASLLHKRVLLVDDNATQRTNLQLQLEAFGMVPIAVESGAAALQRLQRAAYFDLAIVDMTLPDMDGVSLAQKIRSQQAGRELPLILLTSVAQQQYNFILQELAINAHLTKPIKYTQFFDAIIGQFSKSASKANTDAVRFDASMAKTFPREILVAEDNQVNQRFIFKVLNNLGYTPDLALNGHHVLELLEQKRYDLILMDIQMPEMDGIEAATQIRQRFVEKNRPRIIALTAHAMAGDREKFLKAGMTDYLSKPVKINELVQAIKGNQRPQGLNEESPALPEITADNTITVDYISRTMGLDNDDAHDIILDMLDIFMTETSELWQEIEDGIVLDDFDQLYRAAHTIKSSSKIIGAFRFSEYAEWLADSINKKDVSSIQYLVENMKIEKDRLFSATQQLCNQLNGDIYKS